MDVHNRGSLWDSCHLGPPARDPSDHCSFKRDAVWGRDLFHDAVEWTATSGSFELAFY